MHVHVCIQYGNMCVYVCIFFPSNLNTIDVYLEAEYLTYTVVNTHSKPVKKKYFQNNYLYNTSNSITICPFWWAPTYSMLFSLIRLRFVTHLKEHFKILCPFGKLMHTTIVLRLTILCCGLLFLSSFLSLDILVLFTCWNRWFCISLMFGKFSPYPSCFQQTNLPHAFHPLVIPLVLYGHYPDNFIIYRGSLSSPGAWLHSIGYLRKDPIKAANAPDLRPVPLTFPVRLELCLMTVPIPVKRDSNFCGCALTHISSECGVWSKKHCKDFVSLTWAINLVCFYRIQNSKSL